MITVEQYTTRGIYRGKHKERPIYGTPRTHQRRLAAKITLEVDRRAMLMDLSVFIDQFGTIDITLYTGEHNLALLTVHPSGQWWAAPYFSDRGFPGARTGKARDWRKAVRTLMGFLSVEHDYGFEYSTRGGVVSGEAEYSTRGGVVSGEIESK